MLQHQYAARLLREEAGQGTAAQGDSINVVGKVGQAAMRQAGMQVQIDGSASPRSTAVQEAI